MQQFSRILAAFGAAVFMAAIYFTVMGTAMAAVEIPVRSLPDSGTVTVTGTVEKVADERSFTLRDDSGSIRVELVGGESVVLKEGQPVTVTGEVEKRLWGLMGKEIAAREVDVHKNLSTALSDAITKTTGLTMEQAQAADIAHLPAEGMVKLTGTVNTIDNEKSFLLQDPTGTIPVVVDSNEKVALAKGAQVAVIGFTDDTALGNRKFRANRVVVLANPPTSGPADNTPISSYRLLALM